MNFVSGPDSYLCTGGLINHTGGGVVPYFLTANHCISKQSEASCARCLLRRPHRQL